MNHNLKEIDASFKPGDVIVTYDEDKQRWVPHGFVITIRGDRAEYEFLNKQRMNYYYKMHKERPTFIWRFNTDGTVTYNTNVKLLR